ncbi:NB-ARC domain-containing protein [Anabaena lutea]|uniref:NB-ARC domain-containing protein n=1 Tax=Anabaena lutea FACHB-196 TaxID=2692881 RepID=A0ABR8FCR2_9NOST|nr:ATP-binding protein [Anabaena lutea]MBD2568017.1 hypothetical protein [Anabaena lutea FACHB-196]
MLSKDTQTMKAREIITKFKDCLRVKIQEEKQKDSNFDAKDWNLDALEEAILEYSLEGKSYKEMKIPNYSPIGIMHIKGPGLFKKLEKITGTEVRKISCRLVLIRFLEQNGEEINESTTNLLSHINLNVAPDISDFYGREQELCNLETWIIRDRCRLVGIFGMTGIGKTALVRQLEQRMQEHFEYVLFKNLEDSPSLEDILTDMEEYFSNTHSETNINRRISNLVKYLNKYHCLLIFDQWEGVMKGSEISENQQNNYHKFLKKIEIEQDKSCLVFTSLRRPKTMDLMLNKNAIREFSLSGLKNEDAEILLTKWGLSNPGIEALITQYKGHPLALNIASGIIQRHHNNQIAQFLEGTVFIDDVLLGLLDKQFSYLSKLEIDIMQYLATEKEPKLLLQIYEYFTSHFQSDIIQAVDKLWQIRLIEQESIQDIRIFYSLNPLIEKYIRKRYKEVLNVT